MQWFWKSATFFLVVASLYLARDVLIPMALALLFSFLFHPLVKRLQRWGVGRVSAVLITLMLATALIGGVLFHVGNEIAAFVNDVPRYKTELISKVKGIGGLGSGLGKKLDSLNQDLSAALDKTDSSSATGQPTPENSESIAPSTVASDDQATKETFVSAAASARGTLGANPNNPVYVTEIVRSGPLWLSWAESAGTVTGPLSTTGLVIVFTLFMMIYQDDLRDRIIKLVSGGQYVTTTRAINESTERISSYLVSQAIVNASYGFVMTLGLMIVGLVFGNNQNVGSTAGFPNFLLWGFLCAILRFVPYIGPVVAGFFPVAVAITVFPGFNAVIAVLVLIAVVELVSNNLMEPWLYGSSTGISAMAVIFAAVFWGWIWGPVGLLLATPLTVCLVVLGKHVEAFSVFKTLLGDEEPLPIATRFYQRLLARDYDQTLAIAKQTLGASGHVAYLDNAYVPVLRKIRSDREANRLSRDDEATLTSLLKQIESTLQIDKTNDGPAAEQHRSQRPTIFAIPSHHAFEEMVLHQMASDLRRHCGSLHIASTRTIPSAIENRLASTQPDIVILCVLPPGGLLQAEFLCNRVHNVSPETKVLVTFFGRTKHFDRLLVRFRKAGAGYVATSVEQTLQYVISWLESDQAQDPAGSQRC